MGKKYLCLNDGMYDYVAAHHSRASDPTLAGVRAATEKLGGISRMLISEEEGSFLEFLVRATGASEVLEIGTFTGYSAICLARGLPEGGRLLCCDKSEEWTRMASVAWKKAGVSDRIELRLGDASATLEALEPGRMFDLAFIDADKAGYPLYLELVYPRLREGGVVVFDNMLWGGRLAGSDGGAAITDPDGLAIKALNRALASDPRFFTVLLPVADGVLLAYKRGRA